MFHRRLTALVAVVASFVLFTGTVAATPAPHDPFPPPVPPPTNYCASHACTLLCVKNGKADPDGEPASANTSLTYVSDAAGNAKLVPVEHSIKLPHWWYLHQPVTSTHVLQWLKTHPQDYYYGQPPAFIHWDCAPYGIMFIAQTPPIQ